MENTKKALGQRPTGKSSDPVQNALRMHKHDWNIACSEFIARINAFKPKLISFKRGLNGRADPPAGIPAGSIKDPLPPAIPAHLSEVAREFQDLITTFQQLVSEVDSIEQEQLSYSQHRRKPHQAFYDFENRLIVEGSNPLTRLWSGFTNLFSTNPNKVYRVAMLKKAKDLFYHLIDVEELLLQKGTDNLANVRRSVQAIEATLDSLDQAYGTLQKANAKDQVALQESKREDEQAGEEEEIENESDRQVEKETKKIDQRVDTAVNEAEKETSLTSTPEIIKEPEIKPIDNTSIGVIVRDIKAIRSKKLVSDESIERFGSLYKEYQVAKNNKNRGLSYAIAEQLQSIYKEIYEEFLDRISEMQGTHIMSGTPVQELIKLVKANVENDLIKEANPLSRILKRLNHQYGFGDKTSGERIAAYQLTHAMRKTVNEMMDILEESSVDTSNDSDEAYDKAMEDFRQRASEYKPLHDPEANRLALKQLERDKVKLQEMGERVQQDDQSNDEKLVFKLKKTRALLAQLKVHTENLFNDYYINFLKTNPDDKYNQRRDQRFQRQQITREIGRHR